MEKTDIPRTFILVIYFNKHLKQDAFSWHNIQLSGNMIQFKSYKKKKNNFKIHTHFESKCKSFPFWNGIRTDENDTT